MSDQHQLIHTEAALFSFLEQNVNKRRVHIIPYDSDLKSPIKETVNIKIAVMSQWNICAHKVFHQ